ncbi:dermokine [Loxodonta africana]|uniref:dermokine n=1 Tax=Loxodonta africana TaxID=9785 RepID=UPI0030D3B831
MKLQGSLAYILLALCLGSGEAGLVPRGRGSTGAGTGGASGHGTGYATGQGAGEVASSGGKEATAPGVGGAVSHRVEESVNNGVGEAGHALENTGREASRQAENIIRHGIDAAHSYSQGVSTWQQWCFGEWLGGQAWNERLWEAGLRISGKSEMVTLTVGVSSLQGTNGQPPSGGHGTSGSQGGPGSHSQGNPGGPGTSGDHGCPSGSGGSFGTNSQGQGGNGGSSNVGTNTQVGTVALPGYDSARSSGSNQNIGDQPSDSSKKPDQSSHSGSQGSNSSSSSSSSGGSGGGSKPGGSGGGSKPGGSGGGSKPGGSGGGSKPGGSGGGSKPESDSPKNEVRVSGGSGGQEVSQEGSHPLESSQGKNQDSQTSPGVFNFDTFWKNFKSKLAFINWDAINKGPVPSPSTRALLYFSRVWESASQGADASSLQARTAANQNYNYNQRPHPTASSGKTSTKGQVTPSSSASQAQPGLLRWMKLW